MAVGLKNHGLGPQEPDVAACIYLLGSNLLRGYTYSTLYEQHNAFDFDVSRASIEAALRGQGRIFASHVHPIENTLRYSRINTVTSLRR
jgi:hypothetical protein